MTTEWITKILKDQDDEEQRIANLTPGERARIVAEDRLVLDPFLDDLRILLAKHKDIKWYIDPGDITDPQKVAVVGLLNAGFDGIEFSHGLAVEWVYCEEYPVLRPVEP